MNTIEKRDFIHSYLHLTDERFINNLYNLIHDIVQKHNPIIGYTANGKPLTKKDLTERAMRSELDILEGRVISQESLEKEIQNWK